MGSSILKQEKRCPLPKSSPLFKREDLAENETQSGNHPATKDYSSQTFFIRIDWVGWSLKFLTVLSWGLTTVECATQMVPTSS
jgi:hypothetical protein